MFENVSLGAPENAVGFVMWRIVARYQREIDRALAPDNLTNLQFITLALVGWFGREGTPVTQIELARLAGIHPMQVSQTLKALETKKIDPQAQEQVRHPPLSEWKLQAWDSRHFASLCPR